MTGLVVLVVTRWPIAAGGTGVLVLGWKGLVGGGRRGAPGHGAAGGPRRLDGVAARHHRRGRRPRTGHPGLAARRRARSPAAAARPGRPAAHPGADARGAAPLRRRPGRPVRRSGDRRADPQRQAARPRAARHARRPRRVRPRRARHAPPRRGRPPRDPPQRPHRRRRLGRHRPRAGRLQPRLRRTVRRPARPARAVPGDRAVRRRVPLAAAPRQVRDAEPLPHPSARCAARRARRARRGAEHRRRLRQGGAPPAADSGARGRTLRGRHTMDAGGGGGP